MVVEPFGPRQVWGAAVADVGVPGRLVFLLVPAFWAVEWMLEVAPLQVLDDVVESPQLVLAETAEVIVLVGSVVETSPKASLVLGAVVVGSAAIVAGSFVIAVVAVVVVATTRNSSFLSIALFLLLRDAGVFLAQGIPLASLWGGCVLGPAADVGDGGPDCVALRCCPWQ